MVKIIEVPEERRKGNGKYIEFKGVKGNNLKNVNVKFPLGKLIVVQVLAEVENQH